MNVAIVCEYNPFHLGHLHQIEQIKKYFPEVNIIAVMSGNVVQRGEFSILDKLYKTKIALEYGIDCVIEIPSVFSLQSAENFSYYAIKIIDTIGCDYVSFGIETEIKDLISYKDFLLENEANIKQFIAENKNTSYNKNVMEFSKQNYSNYSDEIFKSNNILALEYMKSLDKLQSKCKILPIKRINSEYNSSSIEGISYSASSIRTNLKLLEEFKDKIPSLTYEYLKNNSIQSNKKLLDILSYKLFVEKAELDDVTGYEKGLENLLSKALNENYEDFFENIKNKKYTQTRLQRLILNYILEVDKKFVDDIVNADIEAVRLLGFKKNFDLSTINKNCKIYSLNRDFSKLSDNYKELFEYDVKVSRLLYSTKKVNDFYDFPVIKK
ncbi:MAG: nucleotidyltransferase family protein [Finegoldia magna]|uniref:tRNA(Met) cytidine acetate ligase n=1 Tax=Finegoldia magna TaxID=1260 RepID=UPI0026F08E42|nr:nucleotidyltransferase family protein [Finegoldia magna]MBS5775906.1 nucleotidyltransferase family protein [Finegoldia magna]MDU2574585.1 nucleotidyltransferase family protein [Finegoldia magna]MDU7478527.1 nucleotidyltransferase family protein [Finegoldia magna]MDU7501192.1 nucleotidyltransferase family protein [Finegoldia magna]